MKSDFLKKIIAVTVISTTMGTLTPINAAAANFYSWQETSTQSNGYWQQSSDDWYFYDYSGVLQTGWIYDKGQWYYADSKGVMQTGVIQVEGKIYLLSNNGVMQTGNAIINGKSYTFSESGSATGSKIPEPTKAYGLSGAASIPNTPDKIVRNDDSSPNVPNTEARDPQNLIKYNVRFRDDDGEDLRTKSVEKGEKIPLYTPTKSGYKFVEWNTKEDGDGDGYEVEDSITANRDMSLYAQWEVSDSNTNNGGSSSGVTVLVEEIEVTSDTSSITTKAGTLQMSAKVLPIDASNKSVTWSVKEGTGKATISESGLLTASANGTVIVVATAKDSSSIVGKCSITISGQVDSGTTSNTGGTTGGTTGGDTGGTTTTGGKITSFDPNVILTDVVISENKNIVDLPLLKASAKLPTSAKVTCGLSDGTTKELEIPINDWIDNTTLPFNGTVPNTYNLKASFGALPTGYTSTAALPNPVLKVIVQTAQTDVRTPVTVESITPSILNIDKHIMTIDLLNASGILPSKVNLNYGVGTVVANVKPWSLASGSTLNGSVGIRTLKAVIDVPAGYKLPSGVLATTTIDVQKAQTANIQELVEVNKNTGFILNYAVNEKLNLDNLVITAKYNDGTTKNIQYSEFASNGITTPGYYTTLVLSNQEDFIIPITFNGKTIYTDRITVGLAVGPTVTASDSTKTTYDGTVGKTNDALVFNYTLGIGTKKVKAIKEVSLDDTQLIYLSDYELNTTSNTLTIKASALENYPDKGTPKTHALNVKFEPLIGTELVSSAVNPKIYFISTPSDPSTQISLGLKAEVTKPESNTIKVKGLDSGVQYEYCVIGSSETLSSSSWNNAKAFPSTAVEQEIKDIKFIDGSKLYIRKKSITNGNGAINPPSKELGLSIEAKNIAVTLSSENTINTFSLKAGTTVFKGTIVRQASATSNGIINVVVPNGTDVAHLYANYVLSQTDTDKVKVKIGGITGTDQQNGLTENDFTNVLEYTVIAENGATKVYEVEVVNPGLQTIVTRTDTMRKTITVVVTDTTTTPPTTTTTTKPVDVNFTSEYTDADLGINPEVGKVTLTVPGTFVKDSNQSIALSNIMNGTQYAIDIDKQTAYVGMKFNAYTGATTVKVAANLEDLKNGKNVTTVQLSVLGLNTIGGQYLEQIPVAKYGTVVAGTWKRVDQGETTKYYQWLDSKGNILGYTSLIIKVQ